MIGQNTIRTKQLNKKIVLDIIRKYQPIPRYKIAEKMQLTRGTISNIVSELIKEGLIQPGGTYSEGEGRAGPRSVALKLNSDAMHIIGVHISMKHVQIGLVNLNGDLLKSQIIKISQNITNNKINELLLYNLNDFIREKASNKNIKAVGIGVSGVINSKKDTVIKSNHFNISEYSIVENIQSSLNIPVYLENNVKAMANAERMFGAGKYCSNFLSIYLGDGIGSGMIVNDTLFHDNSIGLGEFGHMTYLPDGIPCWCGNRGCLERYASESAILNRLNLENIKELQVKVNKNDLNTISELKNAGEKIGIVLTSLVNMLRFSEIIFSGNLVDDDFPLLKSIDCIVNKNAYNSDNKRINVYQTTLGKNIGMLGSASLALESVFD